LLPESRDERPERFIQRIGVLLTIATFGECLAGLEVATNRVPSGLDN
jgi:hypothetical protein